MWSAPSNCLTADRVAKAEGQAAAGPGGTPSSCIWALSLPHAPAPPVGAGAASTWCDTTRPPVLRRPSRAGHTLTFQ